MYHNRAHTPFSCIVQLNLDLPVANLASDIAILKNRSNGKNISKLSCRLIWIKVGWIVQVKFLESTADATLCYLCQKLLCASTCEIIVNEIKVLERWCLIADDFCQHFDYSFSVIMIYQEPWIIRAEIKILHCTNGWVNEGLQDALSYTFSLISVFTLTKIIKIKMS